MKDFDEAPLFGDINSLIASSFYINIDKCQNKTSSSNECASTYEIDEFINKIMIIQHSFQEEIQNQKRDGKPTTLTYKSMS